MVSQSAVNDGVALALGWLLRITPDMPPRVAAGIAYKLFNTPIGARTERLKHQQLRESRAVLARAEALDLSLKKSIVRIYHWKGAVPEPDRVRPPRRLVLLTHGWTMGARYMTAFVDPLLAAGFDVAALDFPGHGASTDTKSAAPDAVRSIRLAEEALGGFYAIVGHSFGGSMMTIAAEGAPPMPGEMEVDRLVFLASADRLADILGRFADELKLGDATRDRVVRLIEKASGRTVASVSNSAILRDLGIPSLVVHDPADRVVPFADAERIAAQPRVELYRADGLGHFRILGSKKVIDRVVAFLKA